MTQATRYLIYLASCAVNNTVPDRDRVAVMDLSALYKTARRHMMTAITAMALESAGVRDPAFTQEKGKAIRKNAALDEERAAIFSLFEQQGIWYMPLKGALLKDLYPKFGMRQMSDNDILIDASRASDVRGIMESLGYTTEHFGESHHDIYHKEPIFNFEMHIGLFGPEHNIRFPEAYPYYKDIYSRLRKNSENGFGYHFSDEDFYVFMLAHDYKHYQLAGTGLRSLLDIYVFLHAKPELDWNYLAEETRKLGISDFENQCRKASLALFSGRELSQEEAELVEFMSASGTYGTKEQHLRNDVKRNLNQSGGRKAYLWQRLFLPASVLRNAYLTLDRHPWLIPFYSVWRLIHAVLFRRKTIKNELRVLKEVSDQKGNNE